MAAFELSNFGARIPSLTPTELPPQSAQVATNVRIQGAELQPAPGVTNLSASSYGVNTKTIFRYTDSVWLEWNEEVDVVRSSIASDVWDRVLWTSETLVPKISSNDVISSGVAPHPDVAYDLGVPPPNGTPSAAVTGTPADPNDLPDTRFYVVTMVDKYGAEGVPSNASNEVEWRAGETVTVTLPSAPSGSWVFTAMNIYRTNTGSGGTEFQKVATVAPSTPTWVDNVASDYLGEVLNSTDYDVPNAAMKGLVSTPNGYHVGFFGNTLCFSEPGFPHAWPIKYRLPIKEAKIIGLSVLDDTVVVMTDSGPYLAVGTHPQSTSLLQMGTTDGCLSKRGIVNLGDAGVLYPGPNGAVLVTKSGTRVVTKGLFSKKQWNAMNPSTFLGTVVEGLVVYFYQQTNNLAFIFDPLRPELGVVDYTAAHAQAVYQDPDEGTVYITNTLNSGNLTKFWEEAATPVDFTWKSKIIETKSTASPGVARVRASVYPVLFKLYSGGILHHEKLVASGDIFRFNSDEVLADRFEVELSGAGQVYRVEVGETMDDLF